MDLQASFGVLSSVIERYESCGRSVRDVEASADDGVLSVELELTLSPCPGERGPTLSPETATLTDQGELAVTFAPPELPELPPELASAVTTEPRGVAIENDRPVLAVALTVDPEADGNARATGRAEPVAVDTTEDPAGDGGATGGTAAPPGTDADIDTTADGTRVDGTDADGAGIDGTDANGTDTETPGEDGTATGPAAVRDDSVPPYEDTPYLERLYETCDTFAEMSRRIEMDVSSETVRRYMIEADIHDPTPYDTGDDADPEDGDGGESAAAASEGTTPSEEEGPDTATAADRTGGSPPADPQREEPARGLPDEQLVTDGIGLPADLRVAEIADAVVGSATLYEVHRRLDIDRDRTRRLLRELNLLDLVMGRLATAPEQEVTEDLVAARLRERAGSG